MAMLFWLLPIGTVIGLRNFLMSIQKEDVYHGESIDMRTQCFDFETLFLVPLTLSGTKSFLWH